MICVSDIKLPEEFFSPCCETSFAPTMGDLLKEHFEVADLEEFRRATPRVTDWLDFGIVKIAYRPFGQEYTYWTGRSGLISHPRTATMRHLYPWWWQWGTRPMLRKVGAMTRDELENFYEKAQDIYFGLPIALIGVCFLSALRCCWYEMQMREQGLRNETARQLELFPSEEFLTGQECPAPSN